MGNLPSYIEVAPECKLLGHGGEHAEVYECSDEAVGCSVEEWYPELDEGYYIVEMEYQEVLDHTTDEKIAWAYAVGYDKGSGRTNHVPLFQRSHESRLD